MLLAGPGEGGQQPLELRVVGVQLVQLSQDVLGFLLLPGALVGQLVAAGHVLAHRGPEVHLLQRLVPGLLDDQLLGHLLAQQQLVAARLLAGCMGGPAPGNDGDP